MLMSALFRYSASCMARLVDQGWRKTRKLTMSKRASSAHIRISKYCNVLNNEFSLFFRETVQILRKNPNDMHNYLLRLTTLQVLPNLLQRFLSRDFVILFYFLRPYLVIRQLDSTTVPNNRGENGSSSTSREVCSTGKLTEDAFK